MTGQGCGGRATLGLNLRVAHIQGFIRPAHRDLIQVSDDLGDLLSKLTTCDLPDFPPLTPRG